MLKELTLRSTVYLVTGYRGYVVCDGQGIIAHLGGGEGRGALQ